MKKLRNFLTFLIAIVIFSCSSDDNSADMNTDDQQMTDDDGGTPPPIVRTAICESGMAGDFPCNDYDLLYRFTLEELDGARGNDSWGWTDPSTGTEYALMGLDNGVAFVDISAETPIYLGKLPTATSSSSWRDVKVYNNHAFIVSEAQNHGMQVFDLTNLRNVENPPINFSADANFNEFGNAHNIVINEDSGYAYAVGNRPSFNGGPIFINIQDPKNPIGEGGYEMDAYSHDAQVVTYNGPDSDYTGKEILIGSNENEIVIVDITDKGNPINISSISYGQVGYTHQGWFTEDQGYFILGDETDEIGSGFNTRTLLFDFTDLDNPSLITEFYGSTPAVDHNGYVKGDLFYLANYTAGMKVFNVSNIADGTMTEVGSFDTFPSNNEAAFNGAWNVYPYFESGKIIISDIDTGLYIIKKK